MQLMSAQATTVPTLTYTEATEQDVDLSNSRAPVMIPLEGGDALDPLDTPPNEQYYSVVQPGMRITEIQPELEGELIRPPRADGTGGYADVYKGTWTKPDGSQIEVAIKVLRNITPSSMTLDKERLKKKVDTHMNREILVWMRAKHKNIHTFWGYQWRDEPQLVSPWCRHGNLAVYLAMNPGFSSGAKLGLIHQSALGLAYLHNLLPPICHGDIKPENILINDSGEAAISDFGLSRVIESLEVHTGLTTSGGTKGTFVYCAPELAMGLEDRPSCESDVYSFGGLTLSVMSGQVPYHGIKSAGAILKRIMEGKVPQPSDHKAIPENDTLWSLMRNCWKNEASDRPSMQDVITELEEGIAH